MDWRPGLLLTKDPDSVLDWLWNFADWLATGETISSHTVTPDAGITVDASTNDSTGVTVWLSGGTAGQTYNVTVRIMTSQNRTVDRSVEFRVAEQ